MKPGDRVVVLATEHRGTIDSVRPVDRAPTVFVTRDDLPGWPPVPYDPLELDTCSAGDVA